MATLTLHGIVRTYAMDAAVDKDGNVQPNEPSKMNCWSIIFDPPEDEFTDLGPPDDPLLEKKPNAVLYVYNMTIPELQKTRVYGRAKIIFEFETEPDQ